MNTNGILLMLFITSLFIGISLNTNSKLQTGGKILEGGKVLRPLSFPSSDSAYLQQYNELNNVDNVLKRKQYEKNDIIDKVQPDKTDDYYQANISPVIDLERKVSDSEKAIIEGKQPYFLDDIKIVNYYGIPHYWDWRYPKQPIRIQFATNPQKYIKEHPEEYPSYIIKSRDYSNLDSYISDI